MGCEPSREPSSSFGDTIREVVTFAKTAPSAVVARDEDVPIVVVGVDPCTAQIFGRDEVVSSDPIASPCVAPLLPREMPPSMCPFQ